MKLYVGNLPWSIDDNALKELFASYGDVEDAVVIKDKFSKRSKGFGFVTFSSEEDAKSAMSEMHEKEVEGRPLTVNEAKPMRPREDAPKREFSNDEPSEAPAADPSAINSSVEESVDLEVTDDNSAAEPGEEDLETVEEAKEDASSDEPAAESATPAEEAKEESE